MNIRTAQFLVSGIHGGDATSNHTVALVRVLMCEGATVAIHSNERPGRLPPDIRRLAHRTWPGDDIPAADLTILQYPVWFPLAERFGEVAGVRVFWYHGVTPPALWGTNTERELLVRSQIGTELAWHGHVAVAASPFTAAELHQNSGYPMERIRVLPLSIETASFARRPPDALLRKLRARWGLQGKRVLLYTGRIAGNKRIDLLIEGLARLASTHPDVHLLVVGDKTRSPAYREVAARLQGQATRLGVGGRVTFTGRVEAVEPYYHLAHAYVLASQHEGFGVPLVEAMAAGLPIVASHSGAIPWVLDAEGQGMRAAGLTFEPGDADELTKQLARILEDGILRESLVVRGRQRSSEFSPQQFERRVAQVLAEAEELARGSAPLPLRDPLPPLYAQGDIALRNYRVRSGAPLVGRLIEWVRYNSTTHVKEAYVDRIVERQVLYNRLLAEEIARLRAQVARLEERLSSMEGKADTGEARPQD